MFSIPFIWKIIVLRIVFFLIILYDHVLQLFLALLFFAKFCFRFFFGSFCFFFRHLHIQGTGFFSVYRYFEFLFISTCLLFFHTVSG